MKVEERLRAAGIELPEAAARLGQYLPGFCDGRTVYVSGQTGTRDGLPVWTGRVGVHIGVEEARLSASLAAVNALTALRATIEDLDRVRAIARLTVYVNASDSFSDHPRVADAATEVFELAFGESGRSARSAVGVHSLPQNAPVEIDVIAVLEGLHGERPTRRSPNPNAP